MPPVTPSRILRPRRTERWLVTSTLLSHPEGGPSRRLLDAQALGALGADLALGDLLERDRQRLVPEPGLDEGRYELGAALAQLAVVGVDLAGTLGRERHQRVLGVDLREQIVDLGFDHVGVLPVPLTWGDAPMIAATSSAARSARSFTTTWSKASACESSQSALASRTARPSSVSVPRERSRRSSSCLVGGSSRISTASGNVWRTCLAPWTSSSSRTSAPSSSARRTGSAGVPERCPKISAHSSRPPSASMRSNSSSETNR